MFCIQNLTLLQLRPLYNYTLHMLYAKSFKHNPDPPSSRRKTIRAALSLSLHMQPLRSRFIQFFFFVFISTSPQIPTWCVWRDKHAQRRVYGLLFIRAERALKDIDTHRGEREFLALSLISITRLSAPHSRTPFCALARDDDDDAKQKERESLFFRFARSLQRATLSRGPRRRRLAAARGESREASARRRERERTDFQWRRRRRVLLL